MSSLLFTFVPNISNMLRFFCLGSGSSGNCYCLFTENDGLMIDAGIGIRLLKRSFKEYGLSLSQIHHILVTHDHADHVKSVGSISLDYHLPVYATQLVHAGIERNYCVRKKVAPAYMEVIDKGRPFQVGDFTVTPFGVPHDSSDNVGYKIECGNIVFTLMTDIGHVTDEMKAVISETNYLVMEANHDPKMLMNGPYPTYLKTRISGPNGHLANQDCAQALAENMSERMRHVWLCHLSAENNRPDLAYETVAHVLRTNGIQVGTDVLLDVLKRKSPSSLYVLE